MNKLLYILSMFFVLSYSSFSQEDTAYQKKTFLQRIDSIKNWKLETGRSTLTPFIAPSYSPEMKFTITAGGLFTFKTQRHNVLLSRSSVPFSIGYSTNGSLQISIKANIYGKNDNIRFSGEYWLKNMPDNYWGVGYNKARYTPVSDSTTAYDRNWQQFKFKMAFRVIHDFFIGFNYDNNRTTATDINPVMLEDPDYIKHPHNVDNAGIGMVFRFDNRDFPENAYKGILLEISGTGYGTNIWTKNVFRAAEFDYRQYQKIKRDGSTLAWQLKTRVTNGDVPWSEMSMFGNPFDLRGYIWGHYRDRTMLFVLSEYRYMFKRQAPKADGRMYGPFGVVVWAGGGSVAPDYQNMKYWLPNGGVGLRFELQKRMNIRIDYGIGINSKAFYISFNEAF